MKSLQGHFLVASPYLPDPNFYRTVVLMLQHDNEGAFGVVLNRPSQTRVADVLKRLGKACNCQQPTYVGGPVEGPPLLLHDDRASGHSEVLPGLFLATGGEGLRRAVEKLKRFRFLLGYAGWGPGQLDGELEQGGWLVHPAAAQDVFLDPERMWKEISQRIGLEILAPTIGRQQVPQQPWLN